MDIQETRILISVYYSRDDKRYQEKKNRAQRAQLKKEDNARLRKIVDVCLSVDPRIAEFRAAEKKQRNAKKDAKACQDSSLLKVLGKVFIESSIHPGK